MRRLLLVAVRNVLRNRRRSLFGGLAMVIGVGFAMFLIGFFNGFISSVVRAAIGGGLGAIQIHRTGHLTASSDPLKKDMAQDPALLARISSVPGVVAVAGRIVFEALMNNGEQATVVLATAIDPAAENLVCPARRTYDLDGSLEPGDADVMIVGAELARSMQLGAGSTVSLLGVTPQGSANALDITVKGRIESPVPYVSKRHVTVPLEFAQRLLHMPGRVTEYALAVDDLDRAPEIAAAIGRALGPDYEVVTWDQRDAAASQFLERLVAIRALITATLYALVLTFIANVMLLAANERVREIGTMLALGVQRRQVLGMFVAEAATLSFVASLAGAGVGFLVVALLARQGIVLQPPGTKPSTLYPFVTLATVGFSVGVSVLGAMLASLYPAFKASRLRPAEALRAS